MRTEFNTTEIDLPFASLTQEELQSILSLVIERLDLKVLQIVATGEQNYKRFILENKDYIL